MSVRYIYIRGVRASKTWLLLRSKAEWSLLLSRGSNRLAPVIVFPDYPLAGSRYTRARKSAYRVTCSWPLRNKPVYTYICSFCTFIVIYTQNLLSRWIARTRCGENNIYKGVIWYLIPYGRKSHQTRAEIFMISDKKEKRTKRKG